MRRALGKGFSQLVGEQFESGATEVSIDSIVPNSRQPRTVFADEPLQELASSIREHGVLQPLLVRPLDENTYELIAGERRLRASKLAGLASVPVLIKSAGSQNSLELALIENLQREDINALESARAYRRLTEEFEMSQEQVADRVGKSRTAVSNTMRLLRLPKRIQIGLEEGRITEGHARGLLAFDSEAQQLAVYDQILEKGWTVREVERAAKPTAARASLKRHADVDPNMKALEDAVAAKLGAPVRIGGGRISIDYFSDDDLQRILDVLKVSL